MARRPDAAMTGGRDRAATTIRGILAPSGGNTWELRRVPQPRATTGHHRPPAGPADVRLPGRAGICLHPRCTAVVGWGGWRGGGGRVSGIGIAMPTWLGVGAAGDGGTLGTCWHGDPLGKGGPGAGLGLSTERCGGFAGKWGRRNMKWGRKNMKWGEKGCKMERESLHTGESLSWGWGEQSRSPQPHPILQCLATCGHLFSPFPLPRGLGGWGGGGVLTRSAGA